MQVEIKRKLNTVYTAIGICAGLAFLYWILFLRTLPFLRQYCPEPPEGTTADGAQPILLGNPFNFNRNITHTLASHSIHKGFFHTAECDDTDQQNHSGGHPAADIIIPFHITDSQIGIPEQIDNGGDRIQHI